MTIVALIDRLENRGIRLGLDESGNLRIRGDRSQLSDELVVDIREHKEQLVEAIRNCQPSLSPSESAFVLLEEGERKTLPADAMDAYPMTALQAGMVFHTQLERFSGVYHDIVVDHVTYPWNQACFEAALAACIERHPILRSGFRLGGRRPLQYVRPSIALPLVVDDLRERRPEDQDEHIAQWLKTHARHVFDWDKGPLFQIRIFRRSDASFEFAFSFHHAVIDGWSRATLTTQLYNDYTQLLSGRAIAPVTVDWTYRDFVALEQRVLADSTATAYFSDMLREAPERQLSRNEHSSARGEQKYLELEDFPRCADALLGLARQLGVPVQSVLLAAHLKVLSSLSGHSHALSCVTHSGRPEQLGAENAIGLFLNALPLCLPLATESWRELIRSTTELSARAMDYRRYPLSRIQHDMGRNFDEVLFNYTHFHVYDQMGGASDRSLDTYASHHFERSNFNLSVGVSRGMGGAGLRLTFAYNDGVYDDAFMDRLGARYMRAIDALLRDVDQPHATCSLLSEEETTRLLTWGAGESAPADSRCLHSLIEAHAQETPGASAVACDGRALSYRQLDMHANRLAHWLRSQGVGADDRVGVLMERSPSMIIAIVGILKAGAAYVPLEPEHPDDRLHALIEDSAASIVLAQSALAARLPSTVTRLCLDDVEGALATYPATRPEWVVETANLAYVMYTSGSTGKPKGVMIEHRNIVNYVLGVSERLGFAAGMRHAVVSTMAADLGHTVVFGALTTGGTLHMPSRDTCTRPSAFRDFMRREQIDVLKATPSHFMALQPADADTPVFPRRHLILGGEATSASRLEWLRAHAGSCVVHNHYGPTETTVGALTHTSTGGPESGAGLPLGRPLRNVRAYVLDAQRRLAPLGAPGELYLGGGGVGRAYLGRPDLTGERFMADWFADEPGARMYRTGDRVRWLASGELMFMGRVDDQVKVRGYRIEPAEIEAALLSQASTRAAAVTVGEGSDGAAQLVAYIVPHEHPNDDDAKRAMVDQWRTALKARIPNYMVPGAFVVLDALPLTANGKVDRIRLPSPDVPSRAGVEPATVTERVLLAIWQEALGKAPLGVTDHFFDAGGHSILAMHLVALVERRFGPVIGLEEVFRLPTVRDMARHIEQSEQVRGRAPSQKHLLSLKRGPASMRPLFLVHPVGGYAYAYAELARRLKYDGPVYGLQADGDLMPSVEAMADRYIDVLKRISGHGPYLLGGWSMGGVIAFEMTRKLLDTGEKVDALLMVDSFRPGAGSASARSAMPEAWSLLRDLALEFGIAVPSISEEEWERLARQGEDELLSSLLSLGKAQQRLPETYVLDEMKLRYAMLRNNLRAVRSYRATPIDMDIHLIRASENRHPEPTLGWNEVAARVFVDEGSGDHHSIMRLPNVLALVQSIDTWLSPWQTPASGERRAVTE